MPGALPHKRRYREKSPHPHGNRKIIPETTPDFLDVPDQQ
jgi:hypothetical protein